MALNTVILVCSCAISNCWDRVFCCSKSDFTGIYQIYIYMGKGTPELYIKLLLTQGSFRLEAFGTGGELDRVVLAIWSYVWILAGYRKSSVFWLWIIKFTLFLSWCTIASLISVKFNYFWYCLEVGIREGCGYDFY